MEIFANLGVFLVVYGPAIVLGYLLGSIPFGLVITKLAGLGDIRAIAFDGRKLRCQQRPLHAVGQPARGRLLA